MAARLLEPGAPSERRDLGSITLRPHQLSAVERLRSAVAEFGGALLCDQVGMGKTFVALALCDGDACVIAPAVLRDMWQNAAKSVCTHIEFVSTESLSRTEPSRCDARILIVDEAHHFRNPRTRRYSALSKLAVTRSVVLLTATPVHNRKRDLVAMIALFLGSNAETLTDSELGRLVIRREIGSTGVIAGIPEIESPVWIDLNHDDEIPQLILDVPPPLPPRDGGDGGALVIHSLLRQWSSSDAALQKALLRRLQRSAALISALESGTYPSQSELSAWTSVDDSVQLAFAELVATREKSVESLLPVVRSHSEAVSALLRRIRERSGVDAQRADVIRQIRRLHDGISVVAFSQYADTVSALFRDLSRDGGVASLAGDGAKVFGGRISRREAINRFAPIASRVSAPRQADAVTLLLTTDLLSEGVNLQDAAVVVHLDLPWTPARMEQRLGRVARMGSRHDRVFSYVIRPPASTETLIHLENVLRDKAKESSHVVDVFPSLSLTGSDGTNANAPRVSESIRSVLQQWSRRSRVVETGELVVAAVEAPFDGFLGLCEVGTGLRFVAGDRNGVSEDPRHVLDFIKECDGREVSVDQPVVDRLIAAIERHFDGLRMTGGARMAGAHVKRAGLKRIATIVTRARPHDRARIGALASRARSALMSRAGAETERQLEALYRESTSDDDWMKKVAEVETRRSVTDRVRIVAAIVLVSNDKRKQ